MSEDLVCQSCGAPLSRENEKCDYCGAANPKFVRTVKTVKETVKETVYVAPPIVTAATTTEKVYYRPSLFEDSGYVGKFFLLMLIPFAISSFVIMAVPSLISSFLYAADSIRVAKNALFVFRVLGPLSAYWSINCFIRLGSPRKLINFAFLIVIFIVYMVLYHVNVSHIPLH